MLIFGFKKFSWCFFSPRKRYQYSNVGFKMLFDIPLIQKCFPLGKKVFDLGIIVVYGNI